MSDVLFSGFRRDSLAFAAEIRPPAQLYITTIMASAPRWPPSAPTEDEAQGFRVIGEDLQRILGGAKVPYVI